MSYLELARHYDKCFRKYGDNNFGVDWPNQEDTLTRHQVMFDLIRPVEKSHITNSSLLDFGCGLGHFYEWLDKQPYKPNYSGLDINEGFYTHCKNKFPNLDFYQLDILEENTIPSFDYIIVNGVFTEKGILSHNEMWQFFTSVLIELWEKCDKAIAFNLMSKHVDWERDDLFHVSLDELGWFLKEKLNRNFIIRNDYKLYEFTTYVYKK